MISQFIVNGIIAGSIYALIALGFSLIYGTARFFHFAHGAVYTMGAYATFTFFVLLNLPFGVSVAAAIATAAMLGAGLELFIYRPMRARGANNLILLITSLGLFTVLQNLIPIFFGDETKSIRTGLVQEGHIIFQARITTIQIITLVVSVLLYLLTWLYLRLTRMGRMVRAVANDPELSRIIGVNNDKIILRTFVLGSAMAAVASILISLDTDMTPTIGFNALLMGVVAAVIGGIGSVPGSALGGLLVGMAQHLGVWNRNITTQWQDTIVFVILILFLLIRPQGFLGKPIRKASV